MAAELPELTEIYPIWLVMDKSGVESADPAGRVEEFMRLFGQHQRRVYVYLLSLLGNATDAEEAMGQTSYLLWKKFGEFRPGSNFGAWANRVAYLEALKSRQRVRTRPLLLSPAIMDRVAATMDSASDLLERRAEALGLCVETLRTEDQLLIQRRYAASSGLKVMATELDRPLPAIYKALARIRRQLLKCIERRTGQEEIA